MSTVGKTRWRKALGAILVIAAACGIAVWTLRPTPPDAQTQARERAAMPDGMVYVAGGWAIHGTNDPDADDDTRPARRVFVPSFYMDRTEVTNAEYRQFQPTHTFPACEENLPVTNVTYDEAAAYARWAGKRLPTEHEWEKAARGTDDRRYPWGDDWDAARVAARAPRPAHAGAPQVSKKPGVCLITPYSRVRAVGTIPGGASPYGCVDMAGNAWEWVQGFYRGNPEQRILRGGAVGYGERAHRVYNRAIEGAGAT